VTLYRCIILKSHHMGTVFEGCIQIYLLIYKDYSLSTVNYSYVHRIFSIEYFSLAAGETCDVVPVHTLLFCVSIDVFGTVFECPW
jgi:hypothetical protein